MSFQVSGYVTPKQRVWLLIPLQQNSLALNICETIIWLHRPYYAKALYVENDRREISMYGQSYLAVIERCAVSLGPLEGRGDMQP